MPIFIDFLTEHPEHKRRTAGVDNVQADVFPGISRALATRQLKTVRGKDLFGAQQTARVWVCGIGPLLVLKLNAFADREQSKDAYDILLAVSCYEGEPKAAIKAFRTEAKAGNRGFERASETLQKYFTEPNQSGPLRCAAFVMSGKTMNEDRRDHEKQIIQHIVAISHALLQE